MSKNDFSEKEVSTTILGKKATMKNKYKCADEIIQDIAKTLAEASGEVVETIANQVLDRTWEYVGDSEFRNVSVILEDAQGKRTVHNSRAAAHSFMKKHGGTHTTIIE
jgi:hypothetical protein